MNLLIKVSSLIDRLNDHLANVAKWSLFLSCIVSASNALVRYTLIGRGFGVIESLYIPYANGFLEIQWYLFAFGVMLAAPHVFRLNEHVRVDIFYSIYSPKFKVMFDLIIIIVIMVPTLLVILYYVTPLFLRYYHSGEYSPNAGGLIRWPAVLSLPLGFGLLLLQSLSEVIKRLGWKLGYTAKLKIDYEAPLQ
ncbi:MAG: TRAP transporter small permease subunit [SAR324 cluster bacterium]|nr:TRAP transporter small permease subunit [SAR324 cluster bacterium]